MRVWTHLGTGNINRLLPNYIHHQWFGTPDHGLAAALYGPSTVRAPVGNPPVDVTMTTVTDYPFDDTIRITLETADKTATVQFPLRLRVPTWCQRPTLSIAGGPSAPVTPDSKGFVTVKRLWQSGDTVTLHLPADIRATKKLTFGNGDETNRFNPKFPWNGQRTQTGLPFCVVERGALTYALPLEQGGSHAYAIDCDATTMTFESGPMPTAPWNWPLDAPVTIKVHARPFAWPDPWQLPPVPVPNNATLGPPETLTLVPYGSTQVLRVSMFPFLVDKGA